jgi:succinyl-diaminopimelate desuccinylase
VIELLGRLVAAASPNPPGDETQVAEVIRDELRRLGLPESTTHARDPRRPNLFCTIGSGRPHLILAAHMDTMPPGEADAWETAPFEPSLRNGRLAGLGVADMKASIAAMLLAGSRLAQAPPPSGTLTLLFVADEENGSAYGMEWLEREGLLAADAAVVTEPASLGIQSWERLFVSQRGSSVWWLVAHGEPGHSGTHVPRERRASWAFARGLAALLDDELFQGLAHPVDGTRPAVNVATMVKGGMVPFAHPAELRAAIDVRTIEGMSRDGVRVELESRLAEAGLEGRVTLEAAAPPLDWFPPGETVEDGRLLAAAQGACADVLGYVPERAVLPAGTDSAHLNAAGIPALPAFGPGSLGVAHRPNESIALADAERAVALFEALVRRYFA